MACKYLIGDIRGSKGLLMRLIDRIGPTSSDVIIFLGSYLGPGEDSKGVIQYCLDLYRGSPDTYLFLTGCYEMMFKTCIETKPPIEKVRLWNSMGGDKVFSSYRNPHESIVLTASLPAKHNGKPSPQAIHIPMIIPRDHLMFIEHHLHQWFEDKTLPFVATHAGYHPVLFGSAEKEDEVVFARNEWWKNEKLRIPGKEIVFSHVPFPKPYQKHGKIGIDLGAGLGGKLCALEMYERKFTIVG